MNRIQIACYTMLATAFVLTSLILLQASRLIESRAHAEMVVNKDAVTMISTQYQGDSELVYILDSRSGRLFAYMLNPNSRTIDLMATADMTREFGGAQRGGGTPARRER